MRQPLSSPRLTQMVLRYLKDDLVIKSNERVLKEHTHERISLPYPYVYFKANSEEAIELWNSHSRLLKEHSFEKIKIAIGDL